MCLARISLETGNWVELIFSMISFIGTIVAIAISLKSNKISAETLKQNNIMIEETTRPYLVVYAKVVQIESPITHIVVKNLGQSGAKLTTFEIDVKINSAHRDTSIFEGIEGSYFPPQYSVNDAIISQELIDETEVAKITLCYQSETKKYREEQSINLKALRSLPKYKVTPSGKNDVSKEIRLVSKTLQEMINLNL